MRNATVVAFGTGTEGVAPAGVVVALRGAGAEREDVPLGVGGRRTARRNRRGRRDGRSRLPRGADAEAHVQRLEPTQGEPVAEARRRSVERDLAEALEQRAEDDLDLGTCQRRAEAEMHATPERERLDVRASDVEPVGLGIAHGVVIPGTENRHDRLAGGDRDAANLDRRQRVAGRELRRAVVPQQLLRKVFE